MKLFYNKVNYNGYEYTHEHFRLLNQAQEN